MKYEILEHTSDLKIRVSGKNRKELFKNALLGMFEGARYQEEVKTKSQKLKTIKRKIQIKSQNLSTLLVDFLSEVLYLAETKKEVYSHIQFKKFTDKQIEGVLIGKKLKRIGVQIKGVTYHNLDVHQKEDGTWQATILFDI